MVLDPPPAAISQKGVGSVGNVGRPEALAGLREPHYLVGTSSDKQGKYYDGPSIKWCCSMET